MTEAELQAEVTALCDHLGLNWHHCPFARRCDGTPGFPDLVIAGPLGVIFRELKSQDGQTSAGQDLWGWMLSGRHQQSVQGSGACAVSLYAIWRPADWRSGLIRSQLEALR